MGDGRIRQTVAEIDLGAIGHNLQTLRAAAGTAEVHPVVKANAYGHGMVEVARHLEALGVPGMCVALLEEGLQLRDAGVGCPLLVMNGVYGGALDALADRNLTPVVYDAEVLAALAQRAVPMHLKIDTGMSRLGVPVAELPGWLDAHREAGGPPLEGVMTHLASADTDMDATRKQLSMFDGAVEMIRAAGHRPAHIHAANSAGTFRGVAAQHTMVRAGISLYGVQPWADAGCDLRGVLTLKTTVAALRKLQAGTAVGYGGSHVTGGEAVIATCPIGYGDGLLRAASNRAWVLVGGIRCPLVGRVSMDLITVDVTAVPDCRLGDEVVLIGSQADSRIEAEELAQACGTIGYEVLTQLSARVVRHTIQP